MRDLSTLPQSEINLILIDWQAKRKLPPEERLPDSDYERDLKVIRDCMERTR